MTRHADLSAENWPSLVRAFSSEPGLCVFDVPNSTTSAAPIQLLTARPSRTTRLFESAQRSDLSLPDTWHQPPGPEAAPRTTDHWSFWLPLRAGFLSYQDGELELGSPPRNRNAGKLPAMRLAEYDWALLFDRARGTINLLVHPDCPADKQADIHHRIERARHESPMASETAFTILDDFSADHSRDDYLEHLSRIQDYIRSGDVYQVNYAQRFAAHYKGQPIEAFLALHEASPSPCSAYTDMGDAQILSLSPERFLRVQNGMVETRPIKGTRPRGNTPEEDEAQKQTLLNSAKDRAENLMIVDLLRNDLGKCCEIGSVTADPLFQLETFANVHHLVSRVQGKLRADLTPLDLLLSAFPGGSITGAPKRRAMEIIRELEPSPRGAYCGSFFHWTPGNGFDSTIAIRTLVCHAGTIECWGGGGIVADSVPEEEYEESITKIRLFMDVLEGL